jgi:hypothetical protein
MRQVVPLPPPYVATGWLRLYGNQWVASSWVARTGKPTAAVILGWVRTARRQPVTAAA